MGVSRSIGSKMERSDLNGKARFPALTEDQEGEAASELEKSVAVRRRSTVCRRFSILLCTDRRSEVARRSATTAISGSRMRRPSNLRSRC